MFGAGGAEQEADALDNRGQASREGSTTPSLEPLDDFVTVERADLRHGFASSTDLAQQSGSVAQGSSKRPRLGVAEKGLDAAPGRPEEELLGSSGCAAYLCGADC
jgi:hypothetical protein